MYPVKRYSLVIKCLLPVVLGCLVSLSPLPFDLLTNLDIVRSISGLQNLQSPKQALESLDKVLQWEPWRGSLWELLGDTYYDAGQVDQSIPAYQHAQNLGQLSTQGELNLGDAFIKSGQPEQALLTWQTMVMKDAIPAEGYQRLVHLQRQLGKIDDAESTLRRWLMKDPENQQVSFQLGFVLAVLRPVDALGVLASLEKDEVLAPQVELLKNTIQAALNQDNSSYQKVLIGRSLGQLNQWDLAEYAFNQAVLINESYSEAWAFLGEAHEQLGENGWSELQRAQELNPDSVITQALIALHWRREGKPEVAMVYLNAVANLEPNQPEWQVELGNTLAQLGDSQGALKYFLRAVELAPNTPALLRQLAEFCDKNQLKIQEIGLPAARRLVMLSPQDPTALDLMGEMLFNQNDFAGAERFLQRSLDIDPSLPEAHLHLGQVYLESQESEQAYTHLIKAFRLADEGSETKNFAQRLLQRFFGGAW